MADSKRRERCGIDNCRSRRYARADDGYTYCENGHQQPINLSIEAEDEQRTRASRTTKTRATDDDSLVNRQLSNHEANELYLQCFQLVLWKQVHWLVHSEDYPEELETIVHALWDLRLRNLNEMVQNPSTTDREIRLFSTQSDSEDSSSRKSQSFHRKSKRFDRAPRLTETLGLCYFGLILLRVPISMSDLQTWVLESDFVYLNASKAVPKDMWRSLPDRLRKGLTNRTGPPDPGQLVKTTIELLASYSKIYLMNIPPLNHHLILHKHIRALGLPLETFAASTRLAQKALIDFTFPDAIDRYAHRSEHPEVRVIAFIIIAVKLFYPFDPIPLHVESFSEPAATNLDWEVWNKQNSEVEREGSLRSSSESARSETPKSEAAKEREQNERNMRRTEYDALEMTETQIDSYMDWFEETWIGQIDIDETYDKDADFKRAIYGMFPADKESVRLRGMDPDQQSSTYMTAESKRLHAVMSSLQIQRPLRDDAKEEDLWRPGSHYQIYRKAEDVPDLGVLIFEKAAKLVDLTTEQLVLAVFRTEMCLIRLSKKTDSERGETEAANVPATHGEAGQLPDEESMSD